MTEMTDREGRSGCVRGLTEVEEAKSGQSALFYGLLGA